MVENNQKWMGQAGGFDIMEPQPEGTLQPAHGEK
jgi:hypothetical protein